MSASSAPPFQSNAARTGSRHLTLAAAEGQHRGPMMAILSLAARAGAGVSAALLVLALTRWAPVNASPPWDVRALPLFPVALAFWAAAALTAGAARRRPRLSPRAAAVALGASSAALVLVVALRPGSGLPADVLSGESPVGRLAQGPLDVSGPRLRALPFVRRWTFRMDGVFRVPRTATYRLWAAGRGRVEVLLDGRLVLEGDGDPLRAGADVPMGAGEHRLEVRLKRIGPGPRLRLGWTRPDGTSEAIPLRLLGPPIASAWWRLTDALALLCAAAAGALAFSLDLGRMRPRAVTRPLTRAEVVASLAGQAALVALMSWPLVTDPAHLGVMDRPDGRLNAWILAWDAHALSSSSPGRLFQAPAFHPLPDALAYSENLLLPAVMVAPLQPGGPVLAYNAALALSLVLSGLAAQLLIRRVSPGRLAAFVGGAIFAVGAHRWIRLAHLQAQVTMFLPLVLLAFERFWRHRTLGSAALIGAALGLQALSSIYVAAVAAVAAAAALVCAAFGGLRGREALRLAGGMALALALAAPLAVPYLRMRSFQGMEWSAEDVALYAGSIESYAAAGTRLLGPLTQAHLDPERVRDTLFPGVVPLILGVAGLAAAPRRYRAVALVGSAAAVVLSLGPQTALYRFLYDHVVFVRGLRALSRLSLLPVLALCVLAGLALARVRWPWTLAALALALAEATNAPIRYARYEGPSAAARWLEGRAGAAVVLPAGEDDTGAMLDGVAHWRPLVNGDSGFVPRPYTRALELLHEGGPDEAARLLSALGVTHAVTREERPWPLLADLGGERIYAVPAADPPRPIGTARAVAALWTNGAATLDLGVPTALERVVFEVDERPWVAAPLVEASLDGADWTRVPARASLLDATLALYRDPLHGRGEVRFEPVVARFVRLDPRLPARALGLAAGSSPHK
jgi:hypothetical protein